ncbi:MAG: glycoside hydrolase family 3 C-terminal domain-containing protein [Clostridiales bacterium]|nr:glycoside hydrolase family 3 C-terminal domain-containing protein [Clostridiales bacterium]
MNAEKLDIEKTLQALTKDEKLRMLTGDGMWHTFGAGELPRVRMSDGPTGLRMTSDATIAAIPATCFPTQSSLACSWDPALLYNVGAAMGREATALGVNLLLAPGVNIKRNPLGGRNFEYYSEDPFLSGTLGKAFIEGVQSTGVGACVKHFACNNQETDRMYYDAAVDPRALNELYLKPFEIALSAEPAAVMCAYNKLNGTYCSENDYLLTTVLRDRLNYNGVTLSDWGAVHKRSVSFKAGLDLEMPFSPFSYDDLDAALKDGDITEADIDNALRRMLNLIDNVYLEPYGDFDADAHDKLAYAAAAESVILLKNDNNFLPLTKAMKIAVMGSIAENAPIQGGGSSHVTELKKISPLDAFSSRSIDVAYYRGYSKNAKENALLHDEALTAATAADVVIVYAGNTSDEDASEGVDRKSIDLPEEQSALISALTNAGHRVVVVLVAGGPVAMPWSKRVRSIVYQGLSGAGGALATVDAMFGRINPQGRLPETFPHDLDDLNIQNTQSRRVLYRESLFVGYKYYDAIERRVLFPFGHGLSYSNIVYEDFAITRVDDNEFEAAVTLCNRSPRDGYETVQIYVSDRTGRILAPRKQLAGYCKAFVEGGTKTKVVIRVPKSAFTFWNEDKRMFSTPDGEFKIIVAASATDIKFDSSVKINGDFNDIVAYPDVYKMPLISKITDSDFQSMYGAPLPTEECPTAKGSYTLDNCLNDVRHCLIGRIAYSIVKRRAKKEGEPGSTAQEAFMANALNTPLTAAVSMSDGAMPVNFAKAIVSWANGKRLNAIKLLIKKDK